MRVPGNETNRDRDPRRRPVSPRHRTPAEDHEHDSHRSRGHASPLPPRCRPAWTVDQEVRREEPAVGPRRLQRLRNCAPPMELRLPENTDARELLAEHSTCARPDHPRRRDVLRHVRRPPVRRGRDAAPHGRPARRCSTARPARSSPPRRARRRSGFFDADLPERAARAARGRDRDARAAAGGPAAGRAPPARGPQRGRQDRRAALRRDTAGSRADRRRATRPSSTGCATTLGARARPRSRSSTRRSWPRRRPRGHERQARARAGPRRARQRGGRARVRPPARGDRRTTCPARSTTSTPSSCTTCASRSAARARCSASSRRIYPDRLQHFRDEFKRLQAVTGDLRDLDVYLLDFPDLQRLAAGEDARRPGPAARRARDAPRPGADAPPAAPCAPSAPATRSPTGASSSRARSRRSSTVRELASHRITQRLPQDGQDGPGDRRRQPRRGPARAAQGGQGAALPARVLRQPLSRGRRQAVRQDAQGPAGPARPLPGPRGPGQRAARRSRRRRRRTRPR